MPATGTCTNSQKLPLTVSPTTASGAAASIDGPITVTVQSGDGTAANDPNDPKRAFLISGTNIGETVYQVDADADMGAGVVTISDIVTLTVTSEMATNLGVALGTAEPK